MSIFKCKMCGGELDIVEGSAIAKCLYCRTKQTVPKSMDENVQNIFNRANILRLKSEFDKAEALYEKIIQADDTQAEAYWGLILCKYGIEYVDDPATERKIPTCHRASYDSIIADDDYKSAVANADADQRVIYEEQANEIDRIQKEILALAQREEKYDVFICYKETDVNGNRTQDSVIANDIYYQLTNEGFKVFYAAITLEGKLGSAYEPIIFAALNSAKVMLTIGTKPEYFNAVWVRNEWSRFLKIIQKDRSKLLIPCYRDMDAYELPDEFAHLQAQDMAKIGFINDVVRGIKKVVSKAEPKVVAPKETIVTNFPVNIAPLLKRAFMFLEDGDWASADEYCEKVLDQDPENAQAYLGKLMAELKVRKTDGLKSCAEPFDNRPNYQKVMRFADDELKSKVTGYIEFINNRHMDAIYMNAVSMMRTASVTSHYEKAISVFEGVRGWKDTDKLIAECENAIEELKIKAEKARAEEMVRAEIARKDGIYNSAVALMNNPVGSANKFSTSNYEDAIIRFQSISGWKDADEKIEFCKQKIIELKKAAEVEHLEQERIRENARKEAERVAKRNKRIAIVAVSILCAFFIFIILFTSVIVPNGKYNDAIELMESGKYEEAITAFESLNGYKDSEDKILECKEKQFIADNGQAVYDKWGWLQLGDTITFGQYEQDNSTASGNEAIEWIILKVENGKAFVISKYALDYQQFHAKSGYTTEWEHSTIRKWLSEDFYNSAFSNTEKSKILTSTIESEKDSFNVNLMTTTQDKVFLLSVDEAEEYFLDDTNRQCIPSKYALSKGVDIDTSLGTISWWLRSKGGTFTNSAAVTNKGVVGTWGQNTEKYGAVRPAMWIDLKS